MLLGGWSLGAKYVAKMRLVPKTFPYSHLRHNFLLIAKSHETKLCLNNYICCGLGTYSSENACQNLIVLL